MVPCEYRCLSLAEELPESTVKAWKSLFMMAVANCWPFLGVKFAYFFFFSFSPFFHFKNFF